MPALSLSVWLMVAAGALASLGGAYVYGRHDGKTINEAAWQTREAELNAKSAQDIKDNAEKVRIEEHVKADIQNQIAKDLHEAEKERLIAELAAGTRKLSVPARCPTPNRVGVPNPAANLAGNPGEVRAELTEDAARSVVAVGSRCDKITHVLAACQAVIVNDRKGTQ